MNFYTGHIPKASFGVHLGKLMKKLPQLDDVLSRPVFANLAHVKIDVGTLYGPDGAYEEQANDLRECLTKLDERGILRCVFMQLYGLLLK